MFMVSGEHMYGAMRSNMDHTGRPLLRNAPPRQSKIMASPLAQPNVKVSG